MSCNADANADSNDDADAEMPMPRFLNGQCNLTQFNQLNSNDWLICWFIYRSEKQLFWIGLLYNIKVMEETNTTRNSGTFLRRKFYVCNNGAGWILPGELSFLIPSPVNCPDQMPSHEFKIHLRNIKCFLLTGNFDSSSNVCNIQQSKFRKSTAKWYA